MTFVTSFTISVIGMFWTLILKKNSPHNVIDTRHVHPVRDTKEYIYLICLFHFLFGKCCWFVWICIMFLIYKTSSKLYSPPRHQQGRSRQRSKGWRWVSSHSRELRHHHRRPPCNPQVPRGGWARGWLSQAGEVPRLKDHRNRPFTICTQYCFSQHTFFYQHFVPKKRYYLCFPTAFQFESLVSSHWFHLCSYFYLKIKSEADFSSLRLF